MDWFSQFVLKYLSFKGKCFRHCEQPTSLQVLSQEPSRLVGAYVCPDGFVSQVVYFSPSPNMEWFENMITSQVGEENFLGEDVRVASRHGWELGDDAYEQLETNLGTGKSVTEVYWTRYARSEAQKRVAISLCLGNGARKGCLRLFAHDHESLDRFCPTCQAK